MSCMCVRQVDLMWQKFGPGIWEALAKRYTDVDVLQVRALPSLVLPSLCCVSLQYSLPDL